jgi:predicted kinase
LAQVLLRPAAPRLIAIGGLSGSGKSTVAAALAADFLPAPGARHIRSDVVRKSFMQVPPETKLPPSAYTEEVSATVYRLAGEQAATALASGYAALVDATFMNPRERAAIEGIARRAQVPFTGLWLTAPDRVLLDRVAARKGDASDADRAVLLQQLQADIGTLSWARVDVSGDVAAAITGARQALAPGP